MKIYKLDRTTLKTVEDVGIVLEGLGLVLNDSVPNLEQLRQYFTIEDEIFVPSNGTNE
jgi:hypothetical protein